MHWILTILLMVDGRVAVDHQEYFGLHNCQEAALILQQQNKELLGGYGVRTRFACTPKDDSRYP